MALRKTPSYSPQARAPSNLYCQELQFRQMVWAGFGVPHNSQTGLWMSFARSRHAEHHTSPNWPQLAHRGGKSQFKDSLMKFLDDFDA
jgi:hypothetical protein